MDGYRKITDFFESIRPIITRQLLEFRSSGPLANVTDAEILILEVISRKQGVTMSEIAREAGVTKPTITSHTDKLERKKLVRRQRSTKDRRIVALVLTEKGSSILKIHIHMHEHFTRIIADILNKDEINLLIKVMEKIYKSMEKLSGHFGVKKT